MEKPVQSPAARTCGSINRLREKTAKRPLSPCRFGIMLPCFSGIFTANGYSNFSPSDSSVSGNEKSEEGSDVNV
jgi:hypothetical protein